MRRSFKSAVDSWYYLLIVIIPVTVLVPIFFAPSETDRMIGIVIGALAAALPIWLLVSTVYEVHEENLLIRSGPFRWTIPLSDIRTIEPSKSLISSPALSLNRLRIEYGSYKSILVSPEDQAGFIEAVQNHSAQ